MLEVPQRRLAFRSLFSSVAKKGVRLQSQKNVGLVNEHIDVEDEQDEDRTPIFNFQPNGLTSL